MNNTRGMSDGFRRQLMFPIVMYAAFVYIILLQAYTEHVKPMNGDVAVLSVPRQKFDV